MIKLNDKNMVVQKFIREIMDTFPIEDQDINDTGWVLVVRGYKIYTDFNDKIIAVWQLDNCPNPIFEV